MSTTGRLLALLSLLQARRDWPGPALARRLEVSERTVRRDVERLRELGYPVETTRGPDGGYRLGPGRELPPLLLDDGQAVALAVALQTATASGAAVADDAARALATLRQVLPSRLRHRVDAVRVEAVARGSDDGRGSVADPAVIATLASAVRDREVVRFDHWPVDGPIDGPIDGPADGRGRPGGPPRRVEPHAVVTQSGRWYLVGFDLGRDDWRVFRLDRVALRTPNGPRFVPRDLPGGADVATFLHARLRGATDGDWPCRGEVVLPLPAAQVAPYVHDGSVEPLGPDRCRLVIGSWSWAGVVATVVRFGVDVEVVGPPELRAEVAQTAERLARAARAGSAG